LQLILHILNANETSLLLTIINADKNRNNYANQMNKPWHKMSHI